MTGDSWPIDAPSPYDHLYLCLQMQGDEILPLDNKGKGISEDQATAVFERKHGYHPDFIVGNHRGYLWLGPIMEEPQPCA